MYLSGGKVPQRVFRTRLIWRIDLGCLPSCVIKSGTAKISPNGYADRIINYGDSECDCNFDITINGTTYPIVVN